MVFSHGNAVDLGLMLPFYRQAPATPQRGFQSRQSAMSAALSAQEALAQSLVLMEMRLGPSH